MGADHNEFDRMKIAWYTPFGERSAIGAFSAYVVPALGVRGLDVTIVRTETESEAGGFGPQFETVCPVDWACRRERDLELWAAGFDLVVYNVGDYFPFHARCLTHLRRVPGLVILHDYNLHGLLTGFPQGHGAAIPPYAKMLLRDHGRSVMDAYEEAVATGRRDEWLRVECSRYPILSDPLAPALGVVTHAEFYRAPCQEQLGAPVTTIPLAFRGRVDGAAPPVSPVGRQRRLLTFGMVNPNKGYASVIAAIGSDPRLSADWEYRIVGAYEEGYRRRLEQLAATQPHPVVVAFAGVVSGNQLAEELCAADAIACLRYPAFEGASASVVEALQAARPVLVNEVGCYVEIPREFAWHVPPGPGELTVLQGHLRDICDAPERAADRARRAATWATSRHDSHRYADRLVAFIDEVLRERPVLGLVDGVASCLARWTTAPPVAWRDGLRTRIESMFPGSAVAGRSTVEAARDAD